MICSLTVPMSVHILHHSQRPFKKMAGQKTYVWLKTVTTSKIAVYMLSENVSVFNKNTCIMSSWGNSDMSDICI